VTTRVAIPSCSPPLACIALQTSPLGAHPKVWENRKLHIRMSYPREWHLVKISDDKSSPATQEQGDTRMWSVSETPDKRVSATSEGAHIAKLYTQTLFRAEPNSPGPGTTGIEIDIYPKPPDWLVNALPKWPKSPFATSGTILNDFPKSPTLESPAQIENIRGFVTLSLSINVTSTTRIHNGVSFHFQSPKGDYMQFVAHTMTYGGPTPDPENPQPTAEYQSALPTFNAIVHSITFTN